MCLLAKFCDHRSYRNEDINSFINSYMDTLEKAEHTCLNPPYWEILKIRNYRFTVPKSRIRPAEKREEEEEHRQLQNIMPFTQTQ